MPWCRALRDEPADGARLDTLGCRRRVEIIRQPLFRITAVPDREAADAVAQLHVLDARADGLNNAHAFQTRDARQRQSVVEAATHVDGVEVHADRSLAQPHLPRAGGSGQRCSPA